MNIAEFRSAGYPDDTWGIINWARQSNPAVWKACPSARALMLEASSFCRWEAFYQHTNAAHWLAFAHWIAENLDEILSEDK